jgi:hypothetical protein
LICGNSDIFSRLLDDPWPRTRRYWMG